LPLQRARPFQVADYNADVGTLIVRIAKGGQMRHVTLTEEASAFVDRLAVGRAPQDPLLRRDDGRAWKRAEQVRPMREACARAGIVPAVGFHVQRHTHGSLLAMRAVPMAVIARQLGRADTRMTEKHYAHLAPNYVADTIRETFPRLAHEGGSSLRSIAAAKAPEHQPSNGPPRALIKKLLPAEGVAVTGGHQTFIEMQKAVCLGTTMPFFGRKIVERAGTCFVAIGFGRFRLMLEMWNWWRR
jgi:hypothetical protein